MRYETFSKGNKEFIILPIKHFEKLKNDAEMVDDIRAYDEAIAQELEMFPSHVVNNLLDGHNPVMVYRKHRNLTQVDLAGKANISRGHLAQIETGKKIGSVAVLKSLAEVLDVDLDDLV